MVELFEIQRFLPLPYEAALEPRLKRAQDKLQGTAPPDWVRLPEDRGGLPRLLALAEEIRREARALLVVDGGGSCAGVRGVLEYLSVRPGLHLRLLGGLPGPEALEDALALAARGDAVLLAVSGGDGTPAFSLLQGAMPGGSRVLAAGAGGALPGGGGLLAPGELLPLAVCGVDVGALLSGAGRMLEICKNASFANPAWRYAAARRQLCRAGYSVELLSGWDGALRPLLEWVKQLFAASEGKGNRSPLPVVVDYTGDFHTLGQYIQAGPRLFFETAVRPAPAGDPLSDLRQAAAEGTRRAHTEGGVPSIAIDAGERTAEALGRLVYFFQYACGLSACLLDVDPLDRSGVAACEASIRSLLDRTWTAARPAAGTGIL